MKHRHQQQGFTLVEIAVVLVIIGLLLGGVLKGQELIASARVRNLADQQAGIQSAYFGFIDRYRAVPGDMTASSATTAIGTTINTGGDENGRLHAPGDGWEELNAVWEHLSKAGFIKGSYQGDASGPPAAGNNDVSPINVFSSPVILARHNAYEPTTSPAQPDRLLLHLGQNVPAEIARELDLKLDDGRPTTGSLRVSTESGSPTVTQSAAGCVDDLSAATPQWDVQTNVQNCNPAFIF